MKVAFASGKGGTGKTTVAVNVATYLRQSGVDVQLLDCDVEEPNAHIFLKPQIEDIIPATVKKPEVDDGRCTGCGICADYCEFHAIAVFKKTVIIFNELCHGCGVCSWFCPERIITETERVVGVIETGMAGGIRFLQGRLNVGEVAAPPLIHQVKEKVVSAEVTLIDCPPGTSCSVIEAARDADMVILVTEPTPFGLYDLSLTVETLKTLNIPTAVVINRCDIGDSSLYEYCERFQLPILAEIPHDRRIAEGYSRGEMTFEDFPEYQGLFACLWNNARTFLDKNRDRLPTVERGPVG